MTFRGNVSIDFDRVIHAATSPWTSVDVIADGPVPGALDFIRALFGAGYGVVIHTCRANDPRAEPAIVAWLLKHGLEYTLIDRLNITALKKDAILYIDDKGYRFSGLFPDVAHLKHLKSWNEP